MLTSNQGRLLVKLGTWNFFKLESFKTDIFWKNNRPDLLSEKPELIHQLDSHAYLSFFFFFLLSADHQTEYRQQPVRQRIIRDSSRHSDFERWATLWWQKRVVDRLISGPTQGNTSSCLLSEPLRRAIDHRSLEDISVQIESNVATNEPGNRLLSSPFYTENCFRVSLICGGCGTAVQPCRDFR